MSNVTNITPPDLSGVMSYKGIHALCTVTASKDGGRVLRATHYACCLIYGSSPVWGVWTVGGRFLRFASSRGQIADAYPNHVWRRKVASWNLEEVTEADVETRRARLAERYEARTEPKRGRGSA
jgi:hypothetical protein